MIITLWGATIGVALLSYVIKRNIELKAQIKKAEYIQYIDTSGIEKNPPRFTELMKGTTINFKIDKYDVKITQLNITKGVDTIKMIAGYYKQLCIEIDKTAETKTELLTKDVTIYKLNLKLVTLIYDLSYRFVKNKRRYRKALIKTLTSDFRALISICEECIDYWSCLGKRLSLLAEGTTNRQTYGDNASQSLQSMGLDGKSEIKPRYVLPMKSSDKKTKMQSDSKS